jgi:hypothetical protein
VNYCDYDRLRNALNKIQQASIVPPKRQVLRLLYAWRLTLRVFSVFFRFPRFVLNPCSTRSNSTSTSSLSGARRAYDISLSKAVPYALPHDTNFLLYFSPVSPFNIDNDDIIFDEVKNINDDE